MDNFTFERSLQIGDMVSASFTNSGCVKQFRGRIVGRIKRYWKVKSLEPVWDGEIAGRVFQIAAIEAREYSANNRILKKELAA